LLKNHTMLIIGGMAAVVAVVATAVILLEPNPLNGNPSNLAITPIAAQAGPPMGMRPGGPGARMGGNARMGRPGMAQGMMPGRPGMGGPKAGRPNMKGMPAGKPGAVVSSAIVGPPPGARVDPFVIPGVKGPGTAQRVPIASIAPTHIITNWAPHIPPPPPGGTATGPAGPASLPGDRVAGIMMNNGVYAIMESNGQSQVVQPGDTLPGGEQVVSIQSDSVTMRTTTNQTVNLPVSAGTSQAGPVGYPGGMPASFNYNMGGNNQNYGRE
jgi:hypothetical protein